jgi:4-hydroxy-2-oxoheptanedioate aldolase
MTGFRDLLDREAVPVGTWVKLAAVESVQIMAHAGFDFVIIDLEHAPLGVESAYRHIAMASALGVVPLVRVPDGTPSTIQKILDAGARGVLVPHVDTAAQAEAVVRAVRFPPRGDRGAGSTSRAGEWGLLPRADYLAGGGEVFCIPQIESGTAVDNVEEILKVDGVDAIFVGAADLALSLGVAPGDPVLRAGIGTAMAAAERFGRPCGLAFGSDAQAGLDAVARGCAFVVLSNDASLLAESATNLVAAFCRGSAGG